MGCFLLFVVFKFLCHKFCPQHQNFPNFAANIKNANFATDFKTVHIFPDFFTKFQNTAKLKNTMNLKLPRDHPLIMSRPTVVKDRALVTLI